MTQVPGHLRKWRFRVRVDGRQLRRTFTGTRAEAQQALARFSSEVQRGVVGVDGHMPFGELLDRWLESCESRLAPKTVHGYRGKVDHRIRPALGYVRIDRIRPAHSIGSTPSSAPVAGRPPASKPCTASFELPSTKPSVGGPDPDQPGSARAPCTLCTPDLHVPSPAQLADLLRRSADDTLSTAIALAAVTGCRRGELAALRWSNVDLTAGTISIARSVGVVRGELIIGPTKTHQVRTVALGEPGVAVLKRRRRYMKDLAERVGVPLDADPYILSDEPRANAPMNPDQITKRFRRVTREFRFHDLRHFAATQLVGAGVDVRTVAARLGHADPSLTLRVYAAPLTERDQHAAEVLGSLLPQLDAP